MIRVLTIECNTPAVCLIALCNPSFTKSAPCQHTHPSPAPCQHTHPNPQGNFSSYLYGDLLTAAASSEALESTLESAFSSNGDSLSSNSLGGQAMPAGCDIDLSVCGCVACCMLSLPFLLCSLSSSVGTSSHVCVSLCMHTQHGCT